MTVSWTPVVLVDMLGSILTLCIAIFCAYFSWKWAKHKTDDIFRHYIFLLTMSIVFFAISRSFGHLVKQILLINDMPGIWAHISPFSGAINSAIFLIIFAFGIYFHRVQRVHTEIEVYRKDLEAVVRERTGQLHETNKALQIQVAERMQAEEKLRQSNVTLQNVLDSSSPLCITDANFEIVQANKAYMEIWPKTSAVEGQNIKCYESRPGALCHTNNCPLQQIIDGKDEVTIESAKYKTREGTNTFIIYARPFRNPKGDLLGVVESFQNISERIEAENAKAGLIEELQEALNKVNLLGGLLPICASCKKIRDDKGYWNQIETYIRDHSEAEFSHGICPDCAKKLYPEFYDKVDRIISEQKK